MDRCFGAYPRVNCASIGKAHQLSYLEGSARRAGGGVEAEHFQLEPDPRRAVASVICDRSRRRVTR